MALNHEKFITIVGCGPGSVEYVTPAAKTAIEHADILAASPSLQKLFAYVRAERIVIEADTGAALEAIAAQSGKRIVVAVSGDPGISSFGRLVIQRFGRDNCKTVAGVSAVQVAFASLGIDWTGAYIVSAHGRKPAVETQLLRLFDRIAVLTGTEDSLHWIQSFINSSNRAYRVWVCENMTLDSEKIFEMPPDEVAKAQLKSLAVIVLVDAAVYGKDRL